MIGSENDLSEQVAQRVPLSRVPLSPVPLSRGWAVALTAGLGGIYAVGTWGIGLSFHVVLLLDAVFVLGWLVVAALASLPMRRLEIPRSEPIYQAAGLDSPQAPIRRRLAVSKPHRVTSFPPRGIASIAND